MLRIGFRRPLNEHSVVHLIDTHLIVAIGVYIPAEAQFNHAVVIQIAEFHVYDIAACRLNVLHRMPVSVDIANQVDPCDGTLCRKLIKRQHFLHTVSFKITGSKGGIGVAHQWIFQHDIFTHRLFQSVLHSSVNAYRAGGFDGGLRVNGHLTATGKERKANQ